MTSKQSAGILLYKINNSNLEVLLVHPGGPFWKNKDEGAWSIPKGELNENENPLAAAIREFFEETGIMVSGNFINLTPIKLKSGKKIFVWALQKDVDASNMISNTFEMEWPRGSGKMKSFPEVDKASWFSVNIAKEKINAAQSAFIDELERKLSF